jgi:hypothetical protein
MSQKYNITLTVVATVTVTCVVNVVVPSIVISEVLASSDADYSFTLATDWHDCQKISTAYQAVYAFETPSFYINICQKDDSYFYLAEAKQNNDPDRLTTPRSSIFIPAYPLENGSVFRAENGNMSYLVVLPFGKQDKLKHSVDQPSEAILTIKRNNQLVSVESSLNKYCHLSETTIVWDTMELQPYNSNQVATVPQHRDIGLDFSVIHQSDRLLPSETFNSNSRFDFYRIDGELHRLTTCN